MLPAHPRAFSGGPLKVGSIVVYQDSGTSYRSMERQPVGETCLSLRPKCVLLRVRLARASKDEQMEQWQAVYLCTTVASCRVSDWQAGRADEEGAHGIGSFRTRLVPLW